MKENSELSVLMASGSSCNENPETQQPKFENFLNVGNSGGYMYQLPPQQSTEVTTTTTTATSSIGLSMIKNWLRNNPTPSNQTDTVGLPEIQENGERTAAMSVYSGGGGGGGRTNELSLSMGTGDGGGFGVSGGGDSLSVDNKRQQMEVATAVDSDNGGGGTAEAVPRKSIDTFGQRTSIYRGVTR